MAKLRIVRPDSSFSDEARAILLRYLCDHWQRTEEARTLQLDNYRRWEKNYRGIPVETVRTVPWYKSSNFVVKLIRIFLDTFVARTLNVIYATRPLYTVDGFPREIREGLELYLNRKALYDWKTYTLTRELLTRGNKNGTCVVKTPWVSEQERFAISATESQIFTRYEGPQNLVIPFEDFAVFPTTADSLDSATIKFHKVRIIEEEVLRRLAAGEWAISSEDLQLMLKQPQDVKREEAQQDAGVYDPYIKEVHAIEAHLKWRLGTDYYSIIALFEPENEKWLDLYFNPYPNNWNIFTDYRPFPREDTWWGESMCELLEQAQEETSQIHNDRRNNSFLANAPVFKRRNGALIPNPSGNWYPGKVFDVESMEDFEVVSIGRNYSDTIAEETFDLQLTERLSGIGSVSQGYAAGMMGKRGIYNATGTLAIMSESNQRQDTNIRDVREVLSELAKTNLALQAALGSDDSIIETLPRELQAQVRQALKMATPTQLRYSKLEVKASNAGSNSETQKQNLMQLIGVLSNYAGAVQQISMQLANPQLNPSLRLIMNDVVRMHKWLATRLLRAFDEYDAEGVLPDVRAAIEKTVPGGGAGTKEDSSPAEPPEPVVGANGSAASPLSREGLAALLAMPTLTPGEAAG